MRQMPDLNVMFQSQQAILQKGGPIFKQAHKLCIATRAFEVLVLGSIKKQYIYLQRQELQLLFGFIQLPLGYLQSRWKQSFLIVVISLNLAIIMSQRDFHLVGWESLKVYSLRLIARLSVCIPQMELTSAQSPTNATIYILMFIPKLRAVLLMVYPIRLLENRPYPDKSKEYRLVAITMKVHHRISFIITRVDSSQLIASLLFTHSSSQ